MYYKKTMEACFVRCKRYTASKTSNVIRTKQNRLMLLSSCAACGKKKSSSLKIKNSMKDYSTILIILEMISIK